MVLKLDELLAHLRSVREMAARLTVLKDTVPGAAAAAAAAAAAPAPPAAPPPRQAKGPARPAAEPSASGLTRRAEDLSPTLQSLAERLAEDHASASELTLRASRTSRRSTRRRSRTASSRCCAMPPCTASSRPRCAAPS